LLVDNHKFELTPVPWLGEVKKVRCIRLALLGHVILTLFVVQGGSVDIVFKLRVFCTTKVYQMLKISVSKNKPSTLRSGRPDEELGSFFISFKIESELSSSIDFDEIVMGKQLAAGGFGTGMSSHSLAFLFAPTYLQSTYYV
jgi:hypothetical protein